MPTRPMAHPPKSNAKSLAQEQRRARLAAELRANLKKRRDQARGREQPDAPAQGHGEDQRDAPEAATGGKRGPTGEAA